MLLMYFCFLVNNLYLFCFINNPYKQLLESEFLVSLLCGSSYTRFPFLCNHKPCFLTEMDCEEELQYYSLQPTLFYCGKGDDLFYLFVHLIWGSGSIQAVVSLRCMTLRISADYPYADHKRMDSGVAAELVGKGSEFGSEGAQIYALITRPRFP